MPSVDDNAPATSACPGSGAVSGRYLGAATIMARPRGTLMKKPTRHDSQPANMPPATSPTVAARSRDFDQRAVGERHPYRLALAAVAVGGIEPAGHARRGDAVAAVRAGAIAEGERRDDEIALRDLADVGTDVLDDAHELVADRPRLERRVAPVVPEVRAAHAGQHDANHRVGGLGDDGVATLADGDGPGFIEDRCTHGIQRSTVSAELRGPARGVLTGHPCPPATRVLSSSWT